MNGYTRKQPGPGRTPYTPKETLEKLQIMLKNQSQALQKAAGRAAAPQTVALVLEGMVKDLDTLKPYLPGPDGCDLQRLRDRLQQTEQALALAEAQLSQCGGLLSRALLEGDWLARTVRARQQPCRQAIRWLDIQLLLGNLHAGMDCGEEKVAIGRRLLNALAEDTPAPPFPPTPPAQGRLSPDLQQAQTQLHTLSADLRAAGTPTVPWQLLAARLLAALQGGEQPLTDALEICGIRVLYYDQAPQTLRYRFSVYENGDDYPGLFLQDADGGQLECLSGGGHRQRDTERG